MSDKTHSSHHWGHSLRTLSWDQSETKTRSQQLISSTVHEWYDAKHRTISTEEIDLLNSVEVTHCPKCGSVFIVSNGHYRNNIRRYLCRDCGRSFNPLTDTIFDDRKIPISEWIEYLLHLFEFHSLTTSARDNRNAYSTGKYWLYKVFEVLKHYQDTIILNGVITYDETFFTVIESEKKRKEDGKEYRGISRNKLCVAAGKDQSGKIILLCENTSKPSFRSTWLTMGDHIQQRSHLRHDKEKSHRILIERLNLTSEIYDASMIRDLKDEENPLDSINEIHSLAKRFMRAHGGYRRDDLQDWMNLISFILNRPYNRYEKVDLFINMALSLPTRVKFRDVMSKKSSD